jgi:hypothetical protein
MLAMFEPSTFPTASPPAPLSDAPIEAASSGALVPNATTVTPMKNGLTPRRRARRTAPCTM